MSEPVPTRRGGGFDLESVLAKSIISSPRVTHPAVEAIFDPDRDDKLSVGGCAARCCWASVA